MHTARCSLLAGTACLVLAFACGGPSENNLFATNTTAGAPPAQAPSDAAGGSLPTTTSDSQGATSAVQGGSASTAIVTAGAASGGVSSGGIAGVSSGGDSGALGGEGGAPGEAGSGGDDDAAPPGSACHDHTTVAPALLADSEANLNGWFAFVDAVQTEVVAAHPGADNTNTAVEFRGGHAVSSGMGWGLFCSDVSRYSGVSFWAKGRGGDHIRFQVAVPATDGQPGRGDCLAECNDHPGESLVLTNVWKQYTVHWDELHQEGWGARGNFAGIANSLLWINDGAVDSFDFEVDQVSLVK